MIALWELCEEGELAEVRAALARGEDVNSKSEDNDTGLMLAIVNGKNSIVRLLLEQPTADLNCTGSDGWTALHWAADSDDIEAVQLLLADPRLSNVNQKNNDGCTPVMIAVFYKKVNTLRELVAHPSVDLDVGLQGESLEEIARWDFLQLFTEISYWTLLMQDKPFPYG